MSIFSLSLQSWSLPTPPSSPLYNETTRAFVVIFYSLYYMAVLYGPPSFLHPQTFRVLLSPSLPPLLVSFPLYLLFCRPPTLFLPLSFHRYFTSVSSSFPSLLSLSFIILDHFPFLLPLSSSLSFYFIFFSLSLSLSPFFPHFPIPSLHHLSLRYFAAFMDFFTRGSDAKVEEMKKDVFKTLGTAVSHDPELRKHKALKILEIGVGTGSGRARANTHTHTHHSRRSVVMTPCYPARRGFEHCSGR